ncbi:DUF898 family protein [Aestuariicoccus sp. MJ-SS9]|uniref:DUF898 family protein n=1 Tax=Aestuariicoccus sp. MJ-SS9 TaxID=3079855 RepID=UPI00290BC60F|nr:DUF898 family protein [Aestuariicoccus sp. MJ-SS9]MDU8909644.1 DUF898 family protein [Aestuariicoccus sp. MJ-SS9]
MDDGQKTGPWERASSGEGAPEPPAEPAAAPEPPGLGTTFHGNRRGVFGLALRTGVLTVLTLGIYRFWMKTRLRRWYWSAIRVGGHPLEYVGDPMEKLLGFLIAVVILAFYIGVVNLLLMFASFSLFQGNSFAYGLSFLGVIPLWFYAQYRARRYVLARTRWRGMRFGLEPGAWGYAGRALVHWLITIVSAGLLWPRMTFALEKYKTDRTWFGDARMVQGGRWQMLYPAMKWLFIAGGLGAVGAGVFYAGNIPLGTGIAVLAGLVGLYGLAYYRVETLRRLTGAKTLEGAGLRLKASPFRVLMIHVLGYVLSGLAIFALVTSVVLIGVLLIGADVTLHFDAGAGMETLGNASRYALIALSVVIYFSVFLLWSALTHALITLPVTRHYALGLAVTSPGALVSVRQRPRDEHTEAEGFAEALDVGASI